LFKSFIFWGGLFPGGAFFLEKTGGEKREKKKGARFFFSSRGRGRGPGALRFSAPNRPGLFFCFFCQGGGFGPGTGTSEKTKKTLPTREQGLLAGRFGWVPRGGRGGEPSGGGTWAARGPRKKPTWAGRGGRGGGAPAGRVLFSARAVHRLPHFFGDVAFGEGKTLLGNPPRGPAGPLALPNFWRGKILVSCRLAPSPWLPFLPAGPPDSRGKERILPAKSPFRLLPQDVFPFDPPFNGTFSLRVFFCSQGPPPWGDFCRGTNFLLGLIFFGGPVGGGPWGLFLFPATKRFLNLRRPRTAPKKKGPGR